MKKEDPHKKIKQIRCVVCGVPVMVDKWGQGICDNCNWYQGEDNLEHPSVVAYPNLVSLNRARLLIKEGKSLKPTLDEFIEAYEQYGEMEFYYKSRRFGLITREGELKFYEWNVKGSIQSYKTADEFRNHANIDGILLKNLWDDVKNSDYING